MGSLISSGIGSGLDISGLVRQLVEAEGAPQATRLNAQEAKAQAKLSALGSLRSALSAFRSAVTALEDIDGFRGRTASVSGSEHLSVAATTSAVPSSYDLEVERYASAHKLASAAYVSGDDVVGTGTLTLSVGAAQLAVEIGSEQNTLAGIAAAINEAANNPGIVATVVNGVAGAQLVLSSTATGSANAITVTQSGGDGGLAALVYDPINATEALTEIRPAQDARVLIDGIAVESSSNSIGGAVEGVTIELLSAAAEGETARLVVAYDKEGARTAVEKLVESYNALVDAIGSVASYDPESSRAGPLFGDAGVRNLVSQLRRELTSPANVDSPFTLLSQLGIETELDGKLSLDPTRLDEAFAASFDSIGALFADDEAGLATRIDALLEPYLAANGVLDSRTSGYKRTIEDVGERRDALEARLQQVEARLFRQFNALDSLLAQLNTTSNYLSQQLNSLPGFGNLFERD